MYITSGQDQINVSQQIIYNVKQSVNKHFSVHLPLQYAIRKERKLERSIRTTDHISGRAEILDKTRQSCQLDNCISVYSSYDSPAIGGCVSQ